MAKRLLALSLLGLLAACSDGPSTQTPAPAPAPAPGPAAPSDIAKSALARDPAPRASAADVAALVTGNTELAFQLYRSLGKGDAYAGKDLAFSPHSISTALAMTYAGARGTTASEMASALHFTLPPERLHEAENALDLALASRSKGGTSFRLRVASSLWASSALPIEPSFLDTLAVNYDNGVRLVSFKDDPEAARQSINAWITTATERKITEALGKDSVDPMTRMVLVNAVYFDAAWQTPFSNIAGPMFHAPDGDFAASFMSHESWLSYVQNDDVDAVMVPYEGDTVDFVAIAPRSFDAFEQTLDAGKLETLIGSMKSDHVDLTMPKLTIDKSDFKLKKDLEAQGMKAAWEAETSDFSGVVSRDVDKLFIKDVTHKAFISLDEKGTEAAAVTVVGSSGGSAAGGASVRIVLDRPFIFAIRDRATGAILFLGRTLHPNP